MQISILLDIEWVIDVHGNKEYAYSVIDNLDFKNHVQIKKIAREKFKQALQYFELDKIVSFVDETNETIIWDTQEITYTEPIYINGQETSYMKVIFKPIIKANGWFFNLEPISPTKIFIDYEKF